MKHLMDFLIFLQRFFLYRGGKGNAKCPIAIADLVLLYNKCMKGQYGKVDVLSFDLYKSCPQLKAQFARYCKVFEHRLRSLVPTYRVLSLNEEQSTKLDVVGFIMEWRGRRAGCKNTFKPLTLDIRFLEHHKTQYLDLHSVAEDRLFAANTSGIA
jgi:hypothetical protein